MVTLTKFIYKYLNFNYVSLLLRESWNLMRFTAL
jgi:hypothetical protein